MADLDEGNLTAVLGVDQDALRAQANFYTAYARMLETQRSAPQLGGVWARLTSSADAWVGPSALASAYRLAAQYTAFYDPLGAADLSIRSGLLYLDADLPFGMFLLTGLLGDDLLRGPDVSPGLSTALHRVVERPARSDPVQETYLALAMAARPWLQDDLGLDARALLADLNDHELVPIGPQSLPLSVYLTLGTTMLRDGQGVDVPLPEQLAALGRGQSASLRAAMRNQYLWERGAAPVNILDLEYAAMSGLAARSGTNTPEQIYRETTDALQGDPLAELPVFAMRQIDQVLPQVQEQAVPLFQPDADGLFGQATATYRPSGRTTSDSAVAPVASERDQRLWSPYARGRRPQNPAPPDGDDSEGAR